MKVDFKGIKTGDISGDAIGNSYLAGPRSREKVKLVTKAINELGSYSVSFIAAEDMELQAMQMDVKWAKAKLVARVSSAVVLDENTSHELGSEVLSISWNESTGQRVAKGTELFKLSFDSETELGLKMDRLEAEIVHSNKAYDLELSRENIDIEDFKILQNNPNPWSESTEILVEARAKGLIQLRIMDTQGRLVYSESRMNEGGMQKFRITSNMIKETGLYIYELEAGGSVRRAKMIRLK